MLQVEEFSENLYIALDINHLDSPTTRSSSLKGIERLRSESPFNTLLNTAWVQVVRHRDASSDVAAVYFRKVLLWTRNIIFFSIYYCGTSSLSSDCRIYLFIVTSSILHLGSLNYFHCMRYTLRKPPSLSFSSCQCRKLLWNEIQMVSEFHHDGENNKNGLVE